MNNAVRRRSIPYYTVNLERSTTNKTFFPPNATAQHSWHAPYENTRRSQSCPRHSFNSGMSQLARPSTKPFARITLKFRSPARLSRFRSASQDWRLEGEMVRLTAQHIPFFRHRPSRYFPKFSIYQPPGRRRGKRSVG